MNDSELLQEIKPMVRRSDGFMVEWDRKAIVRQLLTETKLAKEFFDVRPITLEEAEEIAREVERRVFDLRLRFIRRTANQRTSQQRPTSKINRKTGICNLQKHTNKGWYTSL